MGDVGVTALAGLSGMLALRHTIGLLDHCDISLGVVLPNGADQRFKGLGGGTRPGSEAHQGRAHPRTRYYGVITGGSLLRGRAGSGPILHIAHGTPVGASV